MRQFVTTGQAARTLGLSREMVNVLVRNGELRVAASDGFGHRLFDPKTVERLAADRAVRRGRNSTVMTAGG